MADFSAFYWSRHEIAPFSLFSYNSPIKGICQLFDWRILKKQVYYVHKGDNYYELRKLFSTME